MNYIMEVMPSLISGMGVTLSVFFLDLSWLIAFGVDRFLGDDVTV